MFTTTGLVPQLAERGITLSASQVHRLVTGTPERLSLPVLAALCDIFDVTPAEPDRHQGPERHRGSRRPARRPGRPPSQAGARPSAGPAAPWTVSPPTARPSSTSAGMSATAPAAAAGRAWPRTGRTGRLPDLPQGAARTYGNCPACGTSRSCPAPHRRLAHHLPPR